MTLPITVLGAGAWGTALAIRASERHPTLLWARDPAQLERMRAQRRNERYLAAVALPDALQLGGDFDAACEHARTGLLVIATPMAALRDVLQRLPPRPLSVLWLCKGFDPESARLAHELAATLRPGLPGGVLSGPSFALEVARRQPTALVAASRDAALGALAVESLHDESLRIYTSDDPLGVELGGAVKNVLAIATGIADGMALGENARAALVTRGLAEMTRLGVALGAKAETFMGLSGLGDLVLTATGGLSRNRRVGLALAAGQTLPQILAALGHVAEGVPSAPLLLQRARARGIEMPIAEAVDAVLDGRLQPAEALDALMRRDPRAEH